MGTETVFFGAMRRMEGWEEWSVLFLRSSEASWVHLHSKLWHPHSVLFLKLTVFYEQSNLRSLFQAEESPPAILRGLPPQNITEALGQPCGVGSCKRLSSPWIVSGSLDPFEEKFGAGVGEWSKMVHTPHGDWSPLYNLHAFPAGAWGPPSPLLNSCPFFKLRCHRS